VLSQPEEARRLTTPSAGCADTSEPAGTAGDQDTAVQPIECAPSICARQRRRRRGLIAGSGGSHWGARQAGDRQGRTRRAWHGGSRRGPPTFEVDQLPLLCSMMPMVPSEEAVASTRPTSCGAQQMLLMDAECSVAGDW
jgi:hypothetical protein